MGRGLWVGWGCRNREQGKESGQREREKERKEKKTQRVSGATGRSGSYGAHDVIITSGAQLVHSDLWLCLVFCLFSCIFFFFVKNLF